MKYTSQDVATIIEALKSHDDVIGHCSSIYSSTWGQYGYSVCKEDNGGWGGVGGMEDRR